MVTLLDIQKVLQADLLTEGADLTTVVESACGADLMSDALAFTKSKSVIMTGLTTAQAVRTAVLSDLCAIIFVRGKRPAPQVIAMAEEAGLPAMLTEFTMFEACGRVYNLGIHGCLAKEAR